MSDQLGRVDAILRRMPAEPIIGVEIGVFCGRMSKLLLARRPDLYLIMVDNWMAQEYQPADYQATGDFHAQRRGGEQANYARTAESTTRFAAARRKIMHMDSVAAAFNLGKQSVDFVFLDGDHSHRGVTRDIDAWLPTIKSGGWLGGHDYRPIPDYTFQVEAAVRDAVEKYHWTVEEDEDNTWFVRIP